MIIGFTLLARRLISTLRAVRKNPEFRGLLLVVGGILLMGTYFYWKVEGWRPLDALYFSVVSLATVGYGDLAPKTDAGKIFTMIYILLGIGVLVAFANLIAEGLITSPPRERAEPGQEGPEADAPK